MRTTLYYDDSLHARIRRVVPNRGLNRFIVEAVTEKVADLERQHIICEMKEGYLATHNAHEEVANDWASVEIEGWPE